jgi:hypothetical protein
MTKKPKWEIRVDRYTRYWDEETVVLYSGDMEEQMRNLFYGIKKQKRSPRVIRTYLVDKNGKTVDVVEGTPL